MVLAQTSRVIMEFLTCNSLCLVIGLQPQPVIQGIRNVELDTLESLHHHLESVCQFMRMLLHNSERVMDGLGLVTKVIQLLLLVGRSLRHLGFNTRNLLRKILSVRLRISIDLIDVLL